MALAVAVHALAVAIVNLTPTPKDNARYSQLSRLLVKGYRIVELVAGIVDSRRVKH